MRNLAGKFGAALAVALVACVAVAGCGGAEDQQGSADGGSLQVVATYSILGDIVENVSGEEVEITTLVGPDGDAHTFEAAPADNAMLSEADLIFENGLQLEPWLDDLYESSGSEARRVVVTEDVEPLTLEEEHAHGNEEHAADEEHEHEEDGHEEESEHGDEHGEFDPHAWFDVQNTVLMVESTRGALSEADPENADTYRANAKEYIAELEELDAWISEQTENVPEEDRKLVTSHDTFGYLAEAYGYEVVGTGLASFSTEASDPAAGETAELVEEIEAAGVPAIFAENISNQDLMQQIAAEAGVELAPPLYTDALGEPGTEGDTYVRMVRYDVRTITEALGG